MDNILDKILATKKNEIFGIFRPGGFSSRINYIDHFLETIQIRKDNGQARIVIFLISLIKYFFNRHRFNNKNILSIIIKKIF